MMKAELKSPAVIAGIVALVLIVGFLVFKFAGGSGDLDQGQVKYTPGTPPWMEKGGGEYKPVPDSPGTPPSGNAPNMPPTVQNK